MVKPGGLWDDIAHSGTELAGNFNFGATAYALGLQLGEVMIGSEYAQVRSGLNLLYAAVKNGAQMPTGWSFVDTATDISAYTSGWFWAMTTWPNPVRR